MNLSHMEDFEAVSKAWCHYIDALHRIDSAIVNATNGISRDNSICIQIDGVIVLADRDAAFGESDNTRDEMLALMRKAARARLLGLAPEFPSIGVVVDWVDGLPADIVADLESSARDSATASKQ